jgi:hypothetical protein
MAGWGNDLAQREQDFVVAAESNDGQQERFGASLFAATGGAGAAGRSAVHNEYRFTERGSGIFDTESSNADTGRFCCSMWKRGAGVCWQEIRRGD